MESSLSQQVSEISKEMGDVIKSEGWTDEDISQFNRDDLNEILPGLDKLFKRKKIYEKILAFREQSSPIGATPLPSFSSSPILTSSSSSSSSPPVTASTPKAVNKPPPKPSSSKCSKRLAIEYPDFQIYCDAEVREYEGKDFIPQKLILRMCQSNISNMITACQNLTEPRYPTIPEVLTVCKKLCEIYPGILQNGTHHVFFERMKRRLSNVRPTRKPQGTCPKRSKHYREKLSGDGNLEPAPSNETTMRPETTIEKVSTSSSEDVEIDPVSDRNKVFLNRELAKREPDSNTINIYMDLLFKERRKTMNSIEKLNDRVSFLNTEYPAFKRYPDQILVEVRRILEEDSTFVANVKEKLTFFIQGLLLFSFWKMATLKIVTPAPLPNASDSMKLVLLLPLLEQIFEVEKKKGRRKSQSAIAILENTDDPEKARLKRSTDGVPGILVNKASNSCIVLLGREVHSLHDEITDGFLTFIGLFYVLDVDYPSELVIALSIAHRYLFGDNRVCEEFMIQFDDAWASISSYLVPPNGFF